MPAPDLTPYNTLTLFDVEPGDLVDQAVIDGGTKMPEWVPIDGGPAMVLMEGLALIVAELMYGVNRLPDATVLTLMQLFGITRNPGAAPTTTVTFVLSDSLGHVIPAGTTVRLAFGDGATLDFTTDVDLTIPAGSDTGTVAATGEDLTAAANGIAAGTALVTVSAIGAVDSAALGSDVVNGTDPESDQDWRDRSIQRFTRLNDTLVQPEHFTTEVQDTFSQVARATSVNDWNPGYDPPLNLVATPAGTGGTLMHGATYGYAVTATTAVGETAPTATVDALIPGGADTGSVVLTWDAPTAQPDAGAITGYNIYRTDADGAVLGLVATVDDTTFTYTSTGAGAPGAAPPIANGTGQTMGGYITTAVLGADGATISATDRAAMQADLDGKSLINLTPRVVDPSITTVDVVATVHVLAGEDPAGVEAAVQAALAAYLSTDSWPWSGTVRLNKIIQAIEDVAGVEYATVSTPSGDVALTGVAPLAELGTATLTMA